MNRIAGMPVVGLLLLTALLSGCAPEPDGIGANLGADEPVEVPIPAEDSAGYQSAIDATLTVFLPDAIGAFAEAENLTMGRNICASARAGDAPTVDQQALSQTVEGTEQLLLYTAIAGAATAYLCPDARGWFDDELLLSDPEGFRAAMAIVLSAAGIPTGAGDVQYDGYGYEVVCADGTVSYSGGISGACSHHGGVSG